MKLTLFAVALLATVSLIGAADPECILRKKNGMDMHWANPENCGRFYRCSRGIKREIICPGDNEYSAVSGKCVAAGEGTCAQSNTGLILATSNADSSCATAANGAHIAKPDYCSEFYICFNSVGYSQVCDSGSKYDAQKAACVPDPDGSCWQNTCLVQAEGYMYADPTDCAKFYVCTNKEALAQDCDAGSAWSDTDGACAKDTDKKCWVNYCVGEADGTRIADASDEHSYYLCQNQVTSLQSCGEDAVFNAAIGDCQEQTTTTSKPTTTITTTETTTCMETTTTCVVETTTTCGAVETTICEGGHKQGDFVANPNNCQSFYICDSGHLYEYSCGAGNFFDDEKQICELDTDGKCPQCQASRKKRSASENCACANGLQNGEFAPHATDCDKFYICDNGHLEESSCGVGNVYDSCTKVCKQDVDHTCWPVNYCANATDGTVVANPKQCAGYIVCQNKEETYVDCDSGDYFNAEKGYCMPDADLQCVNPCVNVTKIEFLPYPTNCSKFYFCNAGTAYVETCVNGFFDTERHLCLTDTLCSSNICQGQADGTTFPIANSTKKFTVCLNNIPTERSCPNEKVFDTTYGICLSEQSDNCDATICSNSTEYIAFSTKDKNGTTFCVCKNQIAYEYECAEGYLFNEVLGICYSNSPCDPDICENAPEYFVTANKNNSHAFCLCADHTVVSVLCPNNGIFNPKLGSMGECVSSTPESDADCDDVYCLSEANYTIFTAKNDNLNGFCYCNNSAGYYKPCPKDSLFNTTLEICLPECPVDNCLNQTIGYTFPAAHTDNDFCYCVNSTTVERHTCADGKYYDFDTGVCESEPCDPNVCLNATIANEAYAANDRPSSFCMCDGSKPRLFNCSAGDIFSETFGICVSPILLNCNISLCSNASTKNPYAIPAINNTNAFCYCFSNDSVKLFYCPPGEQYDEDLGICVAPQKASGCDCPGGYSEGEMVPDLNNCRKYFICSNGELQEGDCGVGNFYDSSCSYCKPDVNKQCTQDTHCTCPGGYTQGEMLPNPTDCQLFYICNNGQLKEMDCGASNYFDSEKSVCVPRAVNTRKARSLSAISKQQQQQEDVRMFKGLSDLFKKFAAF